MRRKEQAVTFLRQLHNCFKLGLFSISYIDVSCWHEPRNETCLILWEIVHERSQGVAVNSYMDMSC